MFFRPEEVEGGSEARAGAALAFLALADPDHDLGGVERPRRVDGQIDRLPAVVASRADLDAGAEHRRNPQRVGRTAGEALPPVRERDGEGRRPSGERIGERNLPLLYEEQVLLIEHRQAVADCARGPGGEGRFHRADGNWPAALDERAEDPAEHLGFWPVAAVGPARLEFTIGQFHGGPDVEGHVVTIPSRSTVMAPRSIIWPSLCATEALAIGCNL